ncbi:Protein N-acetyltransferase, RimJ/RimL family [Nonomuraea jiangxiensis]|uniref:Protein N-acetyltransferase, RimJ/RimL family n=1 Tax=Nonomuraea jiangxiensis TaxID=633440 RepID=A0A1G8MHM8_9ACTN|nr:Protein N-acetyltransferase, RimJ/RimL family [Nonomuraea jiangxiensis]
MREWRAGDAPVVLSAFQVPDLRRQAPFPVLTLQDAHGWIASWQGAGHAFAVTVGGRVVGNVAVLGIDGHGGSGCVSYWVVPAARGRGIAAAATGAMARWAFGERGLRRLELRHRMNNPASCRVAVKAGFQAMGIERGKAGFQAMGVERGKPGFHAMGIERGRGGGGSAPYDVERHVRLATD